MRLLFKVTNHRKTHPHTQEYEHEAPDEHLCTLSFLGLSLMHHHQYGLTNQITITYNMHQYSLCVLCHCPVVGSVIFQLANNVS